MQVIRYGWVLTLDLEDVQHNLLCPLLALGSKVTTFEVVAGKARVNPSVQVVENRHRKVRQADHVHLGSVQAPWRR